MDERLRTLERATLVRPNDLDAQAEYAAEARRRGFDFAMQRWLSALTEAWTAYSAKHYPNVPPGAFRLEPGRRYVRVMKGSSAYAFVEKATGAILKPDGWKRPAKGERGSIYRVDCLSGCGPHGVAYLNGFNVSAFPGVSNTPSPLPKGALA